MHEQESGTLIGSLDRRLPIESEKCIPCVELDPGCPSQVGYAGYGFRVVQDDGNQFGGNILLETWHNHNGQEITNGGWCGRLSQVVYQG